jgi:hypothetical protein
VGRIIQPGGPSPIFGPLVGDPCYYNPTCLLCRLTASATWKLTSLRVDRHLAFLPFLRNRIQLGQRDFSFLQNALTCSGAHPASYSVLNGVLSSGGKVASTWNRLLNSICCRSYEWVDPCRHFPYIFMYFRGSDFTSFVLCFLSLFLLGYSEFDSIIWEYLVTEIFFKYEVWYDRIDKWFLEITV